MLKSGEKNWSKSSLRSYLRIIRPHHRIKNFLIFIPLFFSLKNLDVNNVISVIIGFFCFSFAASIIYVINDLHDIEKDRKHTVKKFRPLPSGELSIKKAVGVIWLLSFLLLVVVLILTIQSRGRVGFGGGGTFLYIVLNILYTFYLKNIVLIDITILAFSYILRVFFGAILINSTISVWLYLFIIAAAYYLSLGKRRNEILAEKNTRHVMSFYTHNFLDKNMYMCQTLCIVFYSFWSIDEITIINLNTKNFVFTIPLVLIVFFRYSLDIEKSIDGDPTSLILKDKVLICLIGLYVMISLYILY
jgi:4-hydroxybenzoate polyprenyltransferase